MWTCEEARFTEANSTRFEMDYPQCLTSPPDTKIIVNAKLDFGSLLHTASAFRIAFGAAGAMSFIVHILASEIYVSALQSAGFGGLRLHNSLL